VERGEVDILLGTQMIAKGLDFPGVTLVGVVNADVGIHLPDFRATERTFQLLSQVAGRAGRGKLGGDVLIQTALPEHYAIQAALEHDYVAFATRELKERRNPAYPPMVRLVNVVVSSPAPKDAAGNAEAAARWLRMHVVPGTPVDLIGPAPSPIERLHGRWRWHFLLRSVSAKAVGASARRLQAEFRARGTDVRIAIDRDPSALL
jgi:primosomal protein N' (replication factor Y)